MRQSVATSFKATKKREKKKRKEKKTNEQEELNKNNGIECARFMRADLVAYKNRTVWSEEWFDGCFGN